MYPEFDAVIEKHFELKEHALKIQLSKWRDFPSYMNLHHAKSSCPDMEKLYIACVLAIDGWPRKQKARKNRNNAAKLSSTVLLEHDTQAVNPIRAVEVNGVIEIDLDDDTQDEAAPKNDLQSQCYESNVAIASRSPVNPPPNVNIGTTEVIDLT